MTTLAPPDSAIATPRARTVLRRSLFWVGVVVVIAIVTAVLVVSASNVGGKPDLSANNPAPSGAQALARVLAQDGVTVTETPDLNATVRSAANADATVLLYDPDQILTGEQVSRLSSVPADLVIVQPSYDELAALAPDVLPAGDVSGTLSAGCDLPAAQAAGTITGDGLGYRVRSGAAPATTCFGSGDGISSLVVARVGGHTVTVLGATGVLANESITREGDAALALGLLGGHRTLLWYLPGAADLADSGAPPTLSDLIPTWFAPFLTLAALVALVAGFWRARRLGPLVVERLPVIVRASETMEGRARLYAKNSTRLHALDAIRIGTIARLATLCGLPRTASVDDVVTAVGDVLVRNPGDIRHLLIDEAPATDRDLVRMSDDLTRLERAVRAILRPDPPAEG